MFLGQDRESVWVPEEKDARQEAATGRWQQPHGSHVAPVGSPQGHREAEQLGREGVTSDWTPDDP